MSHESTTEQKPALRWQQSTHVDAACGPIEGINANEQVFAWLGIPFAEKPERWQKPVTKAAWGNVFDASSPSPYFYQSNADFSDLIGTDDCLSVNVWRPNTDATDLPVYVWIHGGGFTVGNSIEHEEYNGASFAEKANVVFVSMNYRLGPLGWFTHPSLNTGDAENDSGNYGTLDIIESLRWVQNNIHAFGGNRNNVTIHGQSAGAMNVVSMLLAPKANGLFHQAIVHSGLQRVYSMEEGHRQANQSLQKMLVNEGTAADLDAALVHLDAMSDSDILGYLKAQSEHALFDSLPREGNGIYAINAIFADGNVIVNDGLDAFTNGTYPNKVPVMTGSTKDETALFLIFGAPQLAQNPALFNDVKNVTTGLWKFSGVDDLAAKITAAGVPVYAYEFTWNAYNTDGSGGFELPGTPLHAFSGSTHNVDVPFFFGNTHTLLSGPMLKNNIYLAENEVSRQQLSETIIAYTANFAWTGNPGKGVNGTQVQWQAWSNDVDAKKLIEFGTQANGVSPRLTMQTSVVTPKDVYGWVKASPLYDELMAALTKTNVYREVKAMLEQQVSN